MNDIPARLAVLERQLSRLRWLALASLGLTLALGVHAVQVHLHPRVPSELVLLGPDGALTRIRGGEIRLEAAQGNRVTVRVDERSSSVALATHGRDAVAPELVLRVDGAGTPASVLLSDRKARNFSHLYVSGGRAGLEIAGLREYQNIALP